MSKLTIILLVILVILIAAVVALYFYGKRVEKKQAAAQEQIEAAKQYASILVIDKKKMRLKDADLPQVVMQNANWWYRRAKVPVVKAKVGPQIVTLICDDKIFDSIPLKKTVKAGISGIYITEIKGVRGGHVETEKKPKNIFARAVDRLQEIGGAKPVK